MSDSVPLLEVSGLVVRYGAVTAVRGVDLAGQRRRNRQHRRAERRRQDVAHLGDRRHCRRPPRAAIVFAGKSLAGIALEDVVARGLALVPEGRHIFASLTVMENLMLGATVRTDADSVRADIDRLFAMFPILGERRRQPAGQLSGGEQQQLAIARALLSRPRLLMLDEPSLGLAPTVVEQVYALLKSVREQGVTILLIEQNAERVFGLSDHVHVMSGGEFGLSGTAAEIKNDLRFDAAYFGVHMRRAGGRPVMERLVQTLVDAVSVGSLYALTALGIGLIFGVMRLINFAHGELITFAAYTLLALFGLPVPADAVRRHRRRRRSGAHDRARRVPAAAQRRPDDAVDLFVRGELLFAEASDPRGRIAAQGSRFSARARPPDRRARHPPATPADRHHPSQRHSPRSH